MKKEVKVNRQSIIAAINKIDNDYELLKGRASFMYNLIHQGKEYPPILVLSIANMENGGEELKLEDFGNTNKPFEILRDYGFEVINKNEDLIKSSNIKLKPKDLIKYIFETSIDKIEKSILAQNKGLSALCLLYKTKMSHQELSEIFGDNVQFNNISTASVPEFIKEISRYSDVNVINIENEINNSQIPKSFAFDPFEVKYFKEVVYNSGLKFNDELVSRFISSLLTKPFVLLTGLSGSGKTKIAQSFVQWICEDESQYKIIPVGADWTNREPLLGYPNGLNHEEYILPDSGALSLIIEASKIENNEKPYFLILDEMNLSHVERYFADFLSVMESEGKISLYSGTARKDLKGNDVPDNIHWPKNLFIIGTVNIDETTYMFSPKVLDRANTIEFRLDESNIKNFFDLPSKIDLSVLKSKGASMAKNFLEIATDNTIDNGVDYSNTLVQFFNELKKVGAEYGYRTAVEMLLLIKKLNTISEISKNECIDIAVMQKLLPKLHGSRSKVSKVLDALILLCLKDGQTFSIAKSDEVLDENIKYPIAFEKLVRMYKNALDNGFTSYAEA
jgi:5-methylcytosine-specific restriction protein B